MKATNRRDFIKICACVTCTCGFGSLLSLNAKEKSASQNNETEPPETNKNEALALQWITELLQSLSDSQLSDAQIRDIVKSSSQAHHDMLNVPEMVTPYIGKPDEFIEFLQNAWGWVIKENKSDRSLIIDENKSFCVCPLLKNSSDKLFPALCYCSEGFAEKMFSAVYQHQVSATVTASVQRGDSSCIYHIKY